MIYNFSAGPSKLPDEVICQAKLELANWHGSGISIMEMSHRSKHFMDVASQTVALLREIMCIPEHYHILFAQGGGRGQFSAVPLNLLGKKSQAFYVKSGHWSQCAIDEAKKYCVPHIIDAVKRNDKDEDEVLPMEQWLSIDKNSNQMAYLHYCPNETVDGIATYETPDFNQPLLPIVADFSSSILSYPINIERFGIIYASAQKNIGPSGLTIIIVRDDLLGRAHIHTPSILNYQLLAEHHSMFNTPPTFGWYLAGLVFEWIKKSGGLDVITANNQHKAALLYQTLDNSDFYHNQVSANNRSQMNVVFNLATAELDQLFCLEAEKAGLHALKGHAVVGGVRASIYNAMPLAGVKALIDFMQIFEKRYG